MKELLPPILLKKMIMKNKNFWTKFKKVYTKKIKYNKEEKESEFKRTASIT